MFQCIDTICQRVDFCYEAKYFGKKFYRIHCTGEEKHWHDDKVHDYAEAFVTVIKCREYYSKRGDAKRYNQTNTNERYDLKNAQLEAKDREQSENNDRLYR